LVLLIKQKNGQEKKTRQHVTTQISIGSSPSLCSFSLMKKNQRNQERLIARPRTRSAPRSWAMILPAALAFGKKAAEMTKGFLQFSLYKPPTET